MNETKHTPTPPTPPPLVIRERGQEIHIDAPKGDPNLSAPYKWSSMAVFYGDENRPEKGRQVALSNARMFVEAREVKRQRDELLRALEAFLEDAKDSFILCREQMESAVAKAKGETNDTKNQ